MESINFSAIETDLTGANLIEASAGTGKTYSIAILVLRLLLEKSIPIEKFLLVTFTEDAARELKNRCANFIRAGLAELENQNSIDDKNIKSIVEKGNRAENRQKLRQALFDLDKAKISTIHSFCHQTLIEFAFETGQSFGQKLWRNIDSLLDQELAQYWRNEVALKEVSDLISSNMLDFNLYKQAIENSIKGKELMRIDAGHNALEEKLAEMLPKIKQQVNNRLKSQNILTFDDMVMSLHAKKDSEDLKKHIRSKFDVIFVDEFQDTDVLQYEIFKSFFQDCTGKIVFYIGDPKQSIYSFRNADLDVYSRAKSEITGACGKILTMNTNYRSTAILIEKCNEFFRKTDNFHPFGANSNINYQNVEADTKGQSGAGLKHKNDDLIPFMVHETSCDVYDRLLNHALYLLRNADVTLNGKKVKPSDLAIILPRNDQCRKIKSFLSREGIPAVVIDDSNIFDTPEAKSLLYLLKAILETTESNINAFMMEPLLGLDTEQVINMNHEEIVPLFKEWRIKWGQRGLPAILEEIKHAFKIQSRWESNTTLGHRVLSNLQQLTDIIQSQANANKMAPEDIYYYLSNKIKAQGQEENDLSLAAQYSVRIESDEEAVKILTIHKSKGLEFPIVLLAELELKSKPNPKRPFFSFKNANRQNTFVKYHAVAVERNVKYMDAEKAYMTQQEEENKRLIYVAVTRAKYHLGMFVKEQSRNQNGAIKKNSTGTIHAYLEALGDKESRDGFKNQEIPTITNYRDQPHLVNADGNQVKLPTYPNSNLPDKNHFKLSYSFISGAHSTIPITESSYYDEYSYEHFIYKSLPKGSQTGNLLHQIFEYIDFESFEKHDEIISRAIERHLPSRSNDKQFKTNIAGLVEKVLSASLGDEGFSLRQINRSQRINELEFNFPVPEEVNFQQLENVFEDEDKSVVTTRAEAKGMMNGFVDMFFEFNKKYYILDWKSNFLGDKYNDYEKDSLRQAMNSNNYHLQYLIYTVALDRYLFSKLPDYDYDKHFGGAIYVFLRGVNPTNKKQGIYFSKPSFEELKKAKKVIGN